MHVTVGTHRISRLLLIVIVLLSHATLTLYAMPPDPDSASCSHFVDNQSRSDGDGSQANPWNDIASHVNDLSPGDVMCIRGDQSAPGRVYDTEEIRLGQSGTANRPIIIQPYPDETVIVKSGEKGNLLVFNGARYWVVQGFTFDHNKRWSRAILLRDNASHNILRNNEIKNGRSDGITLVVGSSDNIIENNYIHDFRHPNHELDAHCILVQVESDNTIIRHNSFHDCSGNGVQLIRDAVDDDAAADNVQIIDNTFRRGTYARIQAGIGIKAGTNLRVANNRFFGYYDHNAINHGGTTTDTVFENNVIFDSLRGFRIHGFSERMVLRNNLIYNIGEYGIQVAGMRDGVIVHNTIVNAQEQALRVVLGGLWGSRFQNNLFVNSGIAELEEGALFGDMTVGHNGWFATEADSVFTASSDVMGGGDPGFVDAAGADYHLTSASPARDAGIDVGVTTDFEGDPRPWGAHPDLGADEYALISPPPTPPPSEWRDICVPQRVEIAGIGMGDRDHTINPQNLALPDPADVSWLLAQVSGTTFRDAPIPQSVTFSSDAPQTFTHIMPASSQFDYTFEQHLEPTGHITATVVGVGDTYKSPRALVLYAKRSMPDAWTSVGGTTYGDVYAGSGDYTHSEVLTFPPLAQASDLLVTAVVIDNDDDLRSLVLEAEAGAVTGSVTEYGPTHGVGLTIFDLTLSQVPAGTSDVVLTLRSPADDGDSGALVGINVSYLCPETQTTSPSPDG